MQTLTLKKAGVAISICDKVDFRTNKIIMDRRGHYIMRKRSIHQEEIEILKRIN